MVTKLVGFSASAISSSVLAKIHMVTKHALDNTDTSSSSVLAKIHMVTKPYGSKIFFMS